MIPHSHADALTLPPALVELQARSQWVCWRMETRKDKQGNEERTKVPYNPRTHRRARPNDPTTWASYEQARAAWERKPDQYEGLGYMFADDYTGIDLDHCIDEQGQLDPWARTYLDRLHSYAEYSPGGEGVHCLVQGPLPAGAWHRRKVSGMRHPHAAVEMYSRVRWFTMTGRHVPGTPLTIEASPQAVAAIQGELGQPAPEARASSTSRPGSASSSDQELLERALAARNGARFRALWQGDTSGYLSSSEADQALCNYLAFWTEGDPARVDRLFRQSGLYRPEKWDRPARAGETYGQGTVARACTSTHARNAGGQPAPTTRQGSRPARGVVIPFPVKEVIATNLHESAGHPLPETPIDQVLECLRREEAGDAQLFTHLFRGRYVYDHSEKAWYAWQGHTWKPDETNQVVNMVSGPLAAIYLETSAALSEQAAEEARALQAHGGGLSEEDEATARAKKHLAWLKSTTGALIQRAQDLRRRHRIQNVLALASAQPPLSITADRWDTDPWLLGTPDGVLDLRNGMLSPGEPEDYIRTTIPTRWRGFDAPAPRFEQFLEEIFADRSAGERAELLGFVQRALGYGITGHTQEHVFLMFYGEEGRNGKDTLMSLLQHVLGPISGPVSNDILIASGKLAAPGSAKSHLCSLQGKRIAWASETDKGARFDVGQVMYLTGGGAISARQLYGRDYTFAPSHLLILLTNHKPHADASDAAFWDRLCPIIFTLRFVDRPSQPNERKRDTSLGQALKQEASGILAWLVRGCLQWQQLGLAIPECVVQARQAYRGEEDTLQDFLQECCVQAPQARARAGKLYERYKTWTSENNLRALNGRAFGLEMKKRFTWLEDKRGIFYQGLSIIVDEETAELFNKQEGGGSVETPEPALEAASGYKISSAGGGSGGTFHKITKSDFEPSIEGVYGNTLHSLHQQSLKNPTQSAQEAPGDTLHPEELTLHHNGEVSGQSVSIPDFPFPRERHYVQTITGLVGYLSRNDRGGQRGVYSLLDGQESHWLPSSLHSLTYEQARAWWCSQFLNEPTGDTQ
jgi:putative DNA primase/helicase